LREQLRERDAIGRGQRSSFQKVRRVDLDLARQQSRQLVAASTFSLVASTGAATWMRARTWAWRDPVHCTSTLTDSCALGVSRIFASRLRKAAQV
jgi:hypothetical protein